jgi:hypothetical protein
MRTITPEQRRALDDLSAEGLLGGLPVQTAEKDIHVTDLLGALTRLTVSHGHFKGATKAAPTQVDDGIQLVFAGGTCLSKAHRLISRMSEDIDIKVVLSDPSADLKKDVGYRARLKALHAAIEELLAAEAFEVPTEIDGRRNPHVRDGHRYFAVGSRYATEEPAVTMLRPELKLELIHRHPRLAVEPVSFGYMYESLAGLQPSKIVTIPCIHVAETLAEKVLSLLRRCHWKWNGLQEGEMDPVLVRHVYDVHRIVEQRPQQLPVACTVFRELVQGDAREFADRDPQFESDPRTALTETLAMAKVSKELQANYADRLLPLIHEGHEVDYATAFASFEHAATQLLAQL